jgi:hypothetical protein
MRRGFLFQIEGKPCPEKQGIGILSFSLSFLSVEDDVQFRQMANTLTAHIRSFGPVFAAGATLFPRVGGRAIIYGYFFGRNRRETGSMDRRVAVVTVTPLPSF